MARCFAIFANRERITSRLFLNKTVLIFGDGKESQITFIQSTALRAGVIFAEMERRRAAQRGASPGRNVGAPSRDELGNLT